MKIVSPVIDVKADYKNMPSYCQPEKYSIAKLNGTYYVRLPGGVIDTDFPHDSPKDCQIDINERAEVSLERWAKSGGTSY